MLINDDEDLARLIQDLTGVDVVKPGGAYPFDSTIQSVFKNRAGKVRLVCESKVIPGMLHIFSPTQMELASQACSECGRTDRKVVQTTFVDDRPEGPVPHPGKFCSAVCYENWCSKIEAA